MAKNELSTKFLPAEKISYKKLEKQVRLFKNMPLIKQLYEAVVEPVVILNNKRQIVFANQNFARFFGKKETELLGLRTGEAINCKNAYLGPNGCGTSEFCTACGVARAILSALDNAVDTRESRIIQADNGSALDFLVKATPFVHKKEKFLIVTLKDISHEKRRNILESIFFHDVLNTVSLLQLHAERIQNCDETPKEVKAILLGEVNKLTQEINGQKMLLDAENFELVPQYTNMNVSALLDELISQYERYARGRKVRLQKQYMRIDHFKSDRSILLRVLGNMVKNAIEDCSAGDTVKIGCKILEGRICFSVHNPSVMPKEVQLQIFQRSFSTKGANRGLGTYSMKLLSERYLKGTVSFTSSKGKGTTFTASYPVNL